MFLKFVFAQTFFLYNLPHILKHISDAVEGGAMQIAEEKIRAMPLIYKYSEKGIFSDIISSKGIEK